MNIPGEETPTLLLGDTFTFDIQKILEDSCYYHASGLDGEIVRMFTSISNSFINVDYWFIIEKITSKIRNQGFYNYRIIHEEVINKSQLRGSKVISTNDLFDISLNQSVASVPFPQDSFLFESRHFHN